MRAYATRYAVVTLLAACGLPLFGSLAGCSKTGRPPAEPERPNVLWVVWDTVRADHLSLYGYERDTTPRLNAWARGARVFDDCRATASSTTPSHASLFTGLYPCEHATHADHPLLSDRFTTMAEMAQRAGYRTYLFAANPHVSKQENMHRGFDTEEHPWDAEHRDEAYRIVDAKLDPADRSSELSIGLQQEQVNIWHIKACGELAESSLVKWLGRTDPQKPYFAFLNYMEAHRPYIPTRAARQQFMTPEQIELSYRIDRSWVPMWAHTFGLREYSAAELELMARVYDACLYELDQLFAHLLETLEAGGHLKNTIVILTADHGEHLGEHHLLDHQYSLYDPLIHVPLIVYYPPKFAPGHERRPVMHFDIMPTLLEILKIDPPAGWQSRAVSLLSPQVERMRLAEFLGVFDAPFAAIRRYWPTWDPTPWTRQLRAYRSGAYKLIWASDGRHELYDIAADPGELVNLYTTDAARARALLSELDGFLAKLQQWQPSAEEPEHRLTPEERARLAGLGYAEPEPEGPTTSPSGQAPASANTQESREE